MRVRAGATIYEINTAAWLQRLGGKYGRPVGLGDVPRFEWDALAAQCGRWVQVSAERDLALI